jgi:signal transduction histidine kinase
LRIPYKLVGSFKGGLFVLAVGIVLTTVIYTDRLVDELRGNSRKLVTLKVERLKQLFEWGNDAALEKYLVEMASKDFPLIVADSTGVPTSWSGLPDLDSLSYGLAQLKATDYQNEWLTQGNNPVVLELPEHQMKFYYYYGDTPQITRLRILPWIEVAVVGTLVLIGYLGFVSIKKNEERSLWIGMARETAHQLGTPLTSLYGWIELLGERPADETLRGEIGRDLERLKTVAERFNQIGSNAPLAMLPLTPAIEEAVAYISRRIPKSNASAVSIKTELQTDISARFNPTLFGWVLENLLKNSVEALKSQTGQVTVRSYRDSGKIVIDVIDTGSGIPRRRWKDVFRPGYTTKARGWGLGLSLTKRIVEDLHHGKIFVAESVVDKGTTIRVVLRSA